MTPYDYGLSYRQLPHVTSTIFKRPTARWNTWQVYYSGVKICTIELTNPHNELWALIVWPGYFNKTMIFLPTREEAIDEAIAHIESVIDDST